MATEHGHEWLTPMLKLVEQIQAADYVGNVYGSTSPLQLGISYLPEFDPDKEVLNVDFNRASGQFEFEYQETASPLYKRWKRKCPANDAFPVFNRFLQLKKWFPKVLINGVTAEVHFGEGTLPISRTPALPSHAPTRRECLIDFRLRLRLHARKGESRSTVSLKSEAAYRTRGTRGVHRTTAGSRSRILPARFSA
jgi:hypothetical protein